MVEKVILEISDEMLQRVQEVAKRTGHDYKEILSNWLTRGAATDAEALIEPNVEYPIYTPIGNEAAAQVLLDALKAHQAAKRSGNR